MQTKAAGLPAYPVAPVLPPSSPEEEGIVVRSAHGGVHPTGGYDRVEVQRSTRTTMTNRSVVSEKTVYWLGVKKNRFDGPAVRVINPQTGLVISQSYYIEDRLSRISGPAKIDGNQEKWWLNRRSFESGRELRSYLRSLKEDEFREAVVSSELRILLLDGFSPGEVRRAIEDEVWSAEGLRALLDGAPAEWARAFESGTAE